MESPTTVTAGCLHYLLPAPGLRSRACALIWGHGTPTEQRYVFFDGIQVGRYEDGSPLVPGQLLMTDPTISRRHCLGVQAADGRCFARDVSRNGTRLDGRRMVAKCLVIAALLALGGLVTTIVYHARFTPYTMVLFMMVGQALMLLAAACFGYRVWSGIRARLRSIVEKRYRAGEIVFRQGDLPDCLYVIGRGEVEVIRETQGGQDAVLARLREGQFFGEIGILSDAPRTATIRASTDVEVLSIHRSYFTSLLSYLPMFREQILSAYQARAAR